MPRRKKKNRIKIVRFFFFTSLFLLLIFGLYKILANWDELNIRKVVVSDAKRLTDKQFENYFLGKNILKVSLIKAKKFFLKNSALKDIEIKRIFPDTIKIKLHERRPLAMLKRVDGVYLIDEEGKIFEKKAGEKYPLINGSENLKNGLKFLEILNDIDAKIGYNVRKVICKDKFNIKLVLNIKNRYVVANVGDSDYFRRARALSEAVRKIEIENDITYVDFRFLPYVVMRSGGV